MSWPLAQGGLKDGGFRVSGLRQLCRGGDMAVMTMSGWKEY